jgi:hypothetical protein
MREQNLEITLTDMKFPLVLRDYESWNHAASKEMDLIQKLRDMEITFISTFYAVLLIKQDTSILLGTISLILIIVMFMLLEARVTVDLDTINQIILDLEKKFSCPDLGAFSREILTWTFSTTLYMEKRPSLKTRFCRTIKAACSPNTLIIWHGFMILTVAVFWIIRFWIVTRC